MNFLDITTYKGPDFPRTGLLDTKVYFKETDTYQLLFKTSFHPRHTFRGLVKSQKVTEFAHDQKTSGRPLKYSLELWNLEVIPNHFLNKIFRDKKQKDESILLPLVTSYLSLNFSPTLQSEEKLLYPYLDFEHP